MASNATLPQKMVASEELFTDSVDDFLRPFETLVDLDIYNGTYLDFSIQGSSPHKTCPILRLARPEDAPSIVEVYDDCYKGTYPYKEMEDLMEVRNMIQNENYKWIVFEDLNGEIIGCFTFVLDFKTRRGYMRGLNIKREFQGLTDIIKVTIGSCILVWGTFKDRIGLWYCENRTAHSKSQYISAVCGVKPLAFYPNKDLFVNRVESDLMQIIYDDRTLREYRRKEYPIIVQQAFNCFLYANSRYNLGRVDVVSLKIKLDYLCISELRKNIIKKVVKDKFGYETITFGLEGSDSYFQFLYTPQVGNFEKTEYEVTTAEELYVFIEEFKNCAEQLGIRYYECFVSAYEPIHQTIFLAAGLLPRGYVPSWKYNRDLKGFEDHILFNYYEGQICEHIELIPEAKELLEILGF
jgi:hypothetical protein